MTKTTTGRDVFVVEQARKQLGRSGFSLDHDGAETVIIRRAAPPSYAIVRFTTLNECLAWLVGYRQGRDDQRKRKPNAPRTD